MKEQISEEKYRKAIEKWQALHPEKRYLDVKQKETIELEGFGIINLGKLISIRRGIYKAMQQGEKYSKYISFERYIIENRRRG